MRMTSVAAARRGKRVRDAADADAARNVRRVRGVFIGMSDSITDRRARKALYGSAGTPLKINKMDTLLDQRAPFAAHDRHAGAIHRELRVKRRVT